MSNDEPDSVPLNSVHVQCIVIGIVGALAAALGFIGYHQYFKAQGSSGNTADAVYQTFLLFMFQFEGELGPKPLPLEIARFAAPVVTSFTVVLAFMRIIGRRLQLWCLKGHVVLCGLGYKGVFLAKKRLRAGKRVVIIEADDGNDWIEVCRSLGAVVLNGDAADEDMLRQARVTLAGELIAVCEKDTTNIQIADLARNLAAGSRPPALAPLRCLVHIVSLKWCASMRSLGALDVTHAGCTSVSFNFFENCARVFLKEQPLDGEWIGPDEPRRIHLVLVEANDMADALMIQAMRVGHFANGERLRITVIDENAEREKNLFYAQFPAADEVADIAFVDGLAQDPAVRADLAAWAADPGFRLVVAVCLREETAAMETALTLPVELHRSSVPVFVRLGEENGIAGVQECARQKVGIRAFGSIQDGCEMPDELDRLPRALHNVYLAKAKQDGRTPGQDLAMRDWDDLNSVFKDSNRQQADHIPVKLRAVKCVALPAAEVPGGEAFAFTDDEVECLARMEHARWCAERFLAGWSRGPSDKARLISPSLVPYDQLEEKIKDYDREAVRNIPKVLWQFAGQGLTRQGVAE